MQGAGRTEDARLAYQRAIETWERLVIDYPDISLNYRELARFLAKCPANSLRDLKRATELATRATDLAPSDAASWYTLGLVQCAGQTWDEARVALEKSLELRPEGTASTWFLLAMTQWQLGDRVTAQGSYTQGAARMEKSGQSSNELQRQRSEMAALLGIKITTAVVADDQDEPLK